MTKITNTNHLILLQVAQKLGIQTKILQTKPIKIKYTYQNKSHIISEKSFGINQSKTAKQFSKNKDLTLQILKKANLPVPKHTVINQLKQYSQTIKTIPFPQTIKPLTGEKGKYIYLNIKNQSAGQQAVNQVLDHYPEGAIIETYHQGNDYRFLLLNHQLIGLSQRISPTITGNGKNTIKQLIKQENQHRFKINQKLNKRMLNRIRNWPRIKFNLNLQGLSLKTILSQDKTITLYPIPNFSTGGSVKTIDPNTIHSDLIKLAKKASQTIGLNIVGIDILIKDLNQSSKNNAVIIETNSDPGLRLHDWPNQGQSQHVTEKILKYIFKL